MLQGLAGEGGFGNPVPSGGRFPTSNAGGGGGFGATPGLVPSREGHIAELRTRVGGAPPSSATPRPVDRPACAYNQCQQQIETAAFAWIEATVPALEVGQAGLSAWYGLRSIDVRASLSQQVRVIGLHYRMLPCDVAGQGLPGMANPVPWGDATGMSAAILIGVNLPITVGAWTIAPCYAQGLNTQSTLPAWQRNTGAINGVAQDPVLPRLLFGPLRFPTGQFSDVSPNVAEADISLQGDCAPVVYGERLDVALVLDPGYVAGGTGQLAGFAQVDLVLGHTIAGKSWNV